ncbi:histidine phosphatase family protein [Methylobacillus methanolivorans]|uniref:Histidine phosphatase family protein n=1 Tax=Methylobacillus methanolivorans TaxID=1848927 RepID=A0ABW8GJY6_9PROT
MQIVLMRHGKPKVDKHYRLNAAEFGVWVEQYNAAGIDTGFQPPQEAIAQANQCAFTVCSNLERSLESARLLGIKRIGLHSSIFREMDIPNAAWRFPTLSLQTWLIFFRLAWALGYSGKTESFKSAKERAHSCAIHLANLASTHGTVLFVGHGSLNWFVAKYLKQMGWLSDEKPPRKYWEYSIFHMHTT